MDVLQESLPLLGRTPDTWARQVLTEPLALLNDHAYLEKKAAANALELLNRWPDPVPPRAWITTLAGIARDETQHLVQVCRLLQARGGRLEKIHKNPYAHALRSLVRKGQGTLELLDRLLVCALIEARSCERFDVLGRVSNDAELSRMYRSLWASEHSHFLVFLKLAQRIRPDKEVQERWQIMRLEESAILEKQSPGPRMHSGFA